MSYDSSQVPKENKPIRAIFSDYDGTLCSASAARDNSLGQNRIPPEIRKALQQISQQIPICIISSKDYFFVNETRSFARVISCLMGIETLSFASNDEQSPPFRRNLLVEESELSASSYALEEIAKNIESDAEFRSVLAQKKYTSDRRILAGITVDWSHTENWDYYKKGVQHFVSAAVTNLSRPPQPVNLYLQKYDFHPFVDVYAIPCNKHIGFDRVLSEVSTRNSAGKNNVRAGNVLYLGDSENDNPAFRKAGIAIGVRSDSRLKPELDCQYYIDFGDLVTFLNKLKENSFVFTKSMLN
jgi:hydroxymethylpyrimidine pyrophosphatase-like HAD family hydrolase